MMDILEQIKAVTNKRKEKVRYDTPEKDVVTTPHCYPSLQFNVSSDHPEILGFDSITEQVEPVEEHLVLSHNFTGWKEEIVQGFLNKEPSFLFCQETWHLPSNKKIYIDPKKYICKESSGMDENQPSRVKKGGLITYVSTKIPFETVVVRKTYEYLITKTGKVVAINCYMPQAQLANNGRYNEVVAEIIAEVEQFGPDHCFIFPGDFNTSGRNTTFFKSFVDEMNLTDHSSEIPYTYSQNTKSGLCKSKIDYFLSKNLPEKAVKECKVDNTIPVRGGHLPISAKVYLPHLQKIEYEEEREPLPKIYIDHEKVNESHIKALEREVDMILPDYNKIANPLEKVTKLFEKICDLSTVILPQKRFSRESPVVPGWNMHVRHHQEMVEQAEKLWRLTGCPRTGHIADGLAQAKHRRRDAILHVIKNKQKLVADAMSDDFASSGNLDHTRCWKPVRAVIKGNDCAQSPMVETHQRPTDIAAFWTSYYSKKLGNTSGTSDRPPPSKCFERFAKLEDIDIRISTQMVLDALNKLRKDGASYDPFGPKMLKLVDKQFAPVFAEAMTEFMNAPIELQHAMLKEDKNNFFSSYVKPILKGPTLNPTSASSYRPISVSHTLTLLLERVIADEFFVTSTPHNFFGYTKERGCDTAVNTLKRIVKKGKRNINTVTLIALDASGAFEGVDWDIIFPRLARNNNKNLIRSIWLMYRFNRYQIKWGKIMSEIIFYALKGTKQGGILSGDIFCEYMHILNERLLDAPGIEYMARIFNALFYADDVLLIGLSRAHTKRLLKICEKFQTDGFITWNAKKTAVIELTSLKFKIVSVGELSCYELFGKKLEKKVSCKYLGYTLTHRLDDDAHIERQAQRLYALANNLSSGLPLHLLDDHRLKKLASAYANVYLLPILEFRPKILVKLRKAHSFLIQRVTQWKEREDRAIYNPEQGKKTIRNRYVYGRLRIKTLETMIHNQRIGFAQRYEIYCDRIKNECEMLCYVSSCDL